MPPSGVYERAKPCGAPKGYKKMNTLIQGYSANRKTFSDPLLKRFVPSVAPYQVATEFRSGCRNSDEGYDPIEN